MYKFWKLILINCLKILIKCSVIVGLRVNWNVLWLGDWVGFKVFGFGFLGEWLFFIFVSNLLRFLIGDIVFFWLFLSEELMIFRILFVCFIEFGFLVKEFFFVSEIWLLVEEVDIVFKRFCCLVNLEVFVVKFGKWLLLVSSLLIIFIILLFLVMSSEFNKLLFIYGKYVFKNFRLIIMLFFEFLYEVLFEMLDWICILLKMFLVEVLFFWLLLLWRLCFDRLFCVDFFLIINCLDFIFGFGFIGCCMWFGCLDFFLLVSGCLKLLLVLCFFCFDCEVEVKIVDKGGGLLEDLWYFSIFLFCLVFILLLYVWDMLLIFLVDFKLYFMFFLRDIFLVKLVFEVILKMLLSVFFKGMYKMGVLYFEDDVVLRLEIDDFDNWEDVVFLSRFFLLFVLLFFREEVGLFEKEEILECLRFLLFDIVLINFGLFIGEVLDWLLCLCLISILLGGCFFWCCFIMLFL